MSQIDQHSSKNLENLILLLTLFFVIFPGIVSSLMIAN